MSIELLEHVERYRVGMTNRRHAEMNTNAAIIDGEIHTFNGKASRDKNGDYIPLDTRRYTFDDLPNSKFMMPIIQEDETRIIDEMEKRLTGNSPFIKYAAMLANFIEEENVNRFDVKDFVEYLDEMIVQEDFIIVNGVVSEKSRSDVIETIAVHQKLFSRFQSISTSDKNTFLVTVVKKLAS